MTSTTLGEPMSHDRSMPDLPNDAVASVKRLQTRRRVSCSETPPEHRLMIAMLSGAIRCIEKYRHALDSRGKRRLAEEMDWILSDDMARLHSFARICEALDLDPVAVRRSLAVMTTLGDGGPVPARRIAIVTAPTLH